MSNRVPSKLPPRKPKPRSRQTWDRVLATAGYPTTMLVLDFETYFSTSYSLRKMSTIEYVMDRRFEVLGLATYWSDEDYPNFYREGNVDKILRCYQAQRGGSSLQDITVVAQNARFDGTILSRKYGINPRYFIDLMGLANHWNSRARNGLKELAARDGLPAKGDTLEFKDMSSRIRYARPKGRKKKGIMPLPVAVPVATEEKWNKLDAYACQDARLELELTKLYLPRLSLPKQELQIMHHTLGMFFEPSYSVDNDLATKLVTDMDAEIDVEMNKVGSSRKEISGEHSFEALMDDALTKAGDVLCNYTKKAKSKKGYKLAIAKKDPEREILEKHPDPYVRNLMAAKTALSSWPNHIKRIRRIVDQCRASGGQLPVPLNYHGAHTGRWSGGENINLQNLGSRGHQLVNQIRNLLVAPPGYELVIADASQIESRVAAWMSGQDDKVEKFNNGAEIYCEFATQVLGRPITKAHDGMDPETHADMVWARNSVGKIGDLACTYGGGTNAIENFAPDLDPWLMQDIVDTYRESHPMIQEFWYGIQKRFLHTAKYGTPSCYRNLFQFYRTPDCNVVIQLPNGRELKYHDVRIKMDGMSPQLRVKDPSKPNTWLHLWGGTLTENVDQAISRDILWEAMAIVMQHPWIRIIHTVHDEMIALVKKGLGKRALPIMIDALRTVPRWATGCPLNAEGVITDRYGTH